MVLCATGCANEVDRSAQSVVIPPPEVIAPCNPSEFRTGSRDVRCESVAGDGSCSDPGLTGVQPGPGGGIMPVQPPPGPEAVCNNINLSGMVVPPRVMFLIDKSGSMSNEFTAGVSRWQSVYDALFDGTNGVVTNNQASMEMGIVFYNGSSQLGYTPTATNNGINMESAFSSRSPGGGTGTSGAINALRMVIPAGTTIILATDGNPSNRANTETAAALAFAEDNPVHVLSVGTGASYSHLQNVVTNGTGGEYTDPIVATNPAALSAALSTLVGRVGPSCEQPLAAMAPTEMISGCSFTVAGTPVPGDAIDGWTLPSPGTLRFNGDSCTRLQGGDPIVGTCSCQSWTPPTTASWRPDLPWDCPDGTRAAWTDIEVGYYAVNSATGALVPFGDPGYPQVHLYADLTNPITGDDLLPARGPMPVNTVGVPLFGVPGYAYDAVTDIYSLSLMNFPALGGATIVNISNVELQMIPNGFNVPVITHFALIYECRPVE